MEYRVNPKNGDALSVLGFGCMRFPRANGKIDQEETEKLLIHAIENGVNYLDTAYVYGKSEHALGEFFKKGWRSRVKLATKLPHYLVRTYADMDKLFNAQLQRLQTDYIDYYLIHMVPDIGVLKKLMDLGLKKWIAEKKASGQIKNIGFSFHGIAGQFKLLIDAYDWDFCQIQYNYLDENFQAGVSGLEYAASKGLPVIIMEPVRGGKLAVNLPPEVEEIFRNAKPQLSPAQWALKFVFNRPEATVTLSGMSNMQQLKENIAVADSTPAGSLSDSALETIYRARDIIMKNTKVPCTGCAYCMPCPAGVDIPACFRVYNRKYALNNKRAWMDYLQDTGAITHYPAVASKCVSCGKCKKLCPQMIDIPTELGLVAKEFETPVFKLAAFVGRKLMGGKKEKKVEEGHE